MPPRASASLERRSAISAADLREEAPCPRLAPELQGIVRRASSPHAPSRPSSSPAKSIGTPGQSSSAARCRRGGARAMPATVREAGGVVAVEQRSTSGATDSHGTPARKRAHRRDRRRRRRGVGTPTGMPQNCSLLLRVGVVAEQPGPERAQEARVVHRRRASRRAREVGRGSRGRARRRAARRRPARASSCDDLVVEVDVAVAAGHVRDVDAPAVEAELELSGAATSRRTARAARRCASSSFGSDGMPQPRLVAVRERRRRSSRSARSGASGSACAARNHSWPVAGVVRA